MLLAGVFGKWNVNKGSWEFMVNTKIGGKLFTTKDDLKFDELVQMVHEEFGIDRLVQELELSYALPKIMLGDMPKNMYPVFVSNDRQLDTLREIDRSMTVLLCISLKNVDLGDQDQGLNFRENHIVYGIGYVHSDIDRLVQELELSYTLPKTMLGDMPKNMYPVFVSNDRQLDTLHEICRSMTVLLCISLKNVDLGDQDQGLNFRENHIVYGIGYVERHDSDHEPEVEVSNVRDAKVIEKGQWFKNKVELSWIIRMLSIERKFRIFVSKSDTKLLIVKCVDTSCSWMVRGSKTNPSCEFFWVTKFIDKHTCLSRNIGGPRAFSKVISKLLLENFGNGGPNMKTEMIYTTMKKRYGFDSKLEDMES